jgi:hypothetical protein
MEPVNVKFMINESDPNDIDLYAFFPDTMEAYAHIWQHTGIDMLYVNNSREATQLEYEPLHKELASIGYDNLNILNS